MAGRWLCHDEGVGDWCCGLFKEFRGLLIDLRTGG